MPAALWVRTTKFDREMSMDSACLVSTASEPSTSSRVHKV